jgi:hypothetical protein
LKLYFNNIIYILFLIEFSNVEKDLLMNPKDWMPGEIVTIFNSFILKRLYSENLQGSFGDVFPVLDLYDNLKMMVKRAIDQKEDSKISQQHREDSIKKESLILLTLPPHPNIVEIYMVEKIYGTYHIFMEYVEGGLTLASLIYDDNHYSQKREWT